MPKRSFLDPLFFIHLLFSYSKTIYTYTRDFSTIFFNQIATRSNSHFVRQRNNTTHLQWDASSRKCQRWKPVFILDAFAGSDRRTAPRVVEAHYIYPRDITDHRHALCSINCKYISSSTVSRFSYTVNYLPHPPRSGQTFDLFAERAQ